MSILGVLFWWTDLVIAISMVIIATVLYKMGRISKLTFVLFWIGACLGLTWEVPIFIITEFSIYPMLKFFVPPPFPFFIIIASHSLWDGGLFLMGVGLVYLICKKPLFEKFRFQELIILVLWGQAQAIGIELLGTFGGAWEYIPYLWNPIMFSILGHNFTIWIQLVWLAASIILYIIAVKLNPKISGNS